MALVPATIPVSWISSYAGPHRVCYRVVGAPSYICTVPGTPGPGFHPVCLGGGNPCNYDIDILVDDETCDPVNYEGYVQAACEDEASLVGRIPFAVSFTPSPACKRYEATCVNSPVEDATINDGGTGYGDGFYPALPVIGGGGTLATFDVTVVGGIITIAAVNNTGNGYTSAPVIDLSTIPFTPGTPADISVNLRGCSQLRRYDCSGAFISLPIGAYQPGETVFECFPGDTPPEVPSDWSLSEQDGNCLCDCVELDLQNTFDGGSIDYSYVDCNGDNVSGSIGALGSTGPICMVDGTLGTIVNAPAVENIVNSGACNGVVIP